MRVCVPRLVKDNKSGIWFFRWSLPKAHQQRLNQKTLYLSLRTRDSTVAKCHVALLNLRVEVMKKIPDLNEDAIRKLLHIDAERGIFQADTPEEQERGMKILENLGRLRGISTSASADTPSAAAMPVASLMMPESPLFRVVADEVIREISLTLKSASVYKYKTSYDAFREFNGNRFLEDISRDDIKRFKDKLISEGKVPHTINGYEPREMQDENKGFFKKILNDFLNRYSFNPDLFPQTAEVATEVQV